MLAAQHGHQQTQYTAFQTYDIAHLLSVVSTAFDCTFWKDQGLGTQLLSQGGISRK
jgi:hypothetical protein